MAQSRLAAGTLRTVVTMALATAVVTAQGTQRPPQRPTPTPQVQQPVFTRTVNYVSTDLRVRDDKGRFVPNMTEDDFEIYEDGVLQRIEVFYPVIGGRALNAPPVAAPAPSGEGLVLPRAAVRNDVSGRVFVIFIDDLAILGQDTMLARQVLRQIRDHLIQDNDLIGIVSSGYSSISVDLTYDFNHIRLDEAIGKTMGSGMSPDEIVKAVTTSEGPAGLRYMAHTAMKTANEILAKAAQVTDRRKAFIYLSSGYHFNPFKDARLKHQQELYGLPPTDPNDLNIRQSAAAGADESGIAYADPFLRTGDRFAEADLVADLAELIRNANRANMTFYTVDPRGLIAGPSLGGSTVLSSREWNDYIRTTTDSLIALAENTGGFCICNTNDFVSGLERINNETSDYYMIGYNSTNPDPLKFIRRVEIKVKKAGLSLDYRREYTLPRPKKQPGR